MHRALSIPEVVGEIARQLHHNQHHGSLASFAATRQTFFHPSISRIWEESEFIAFIRILKVHLWTSSAPEEHEDSEERRVLVSLLAFE